MLIGISWWWHALTLPQSSTEWAIEWAIELFGVVEVMRSNVVDSSLVRIVAIRRQYAQDVLKILSRWESCSPSSNSWGGGCTHPGIKQIHADSMWWQSRVLHGGGKCGARSF